jgi:hypothetical protein
VNPQFWQLVPSNNLCTGTLCLWCSPADVKIVTKFSLTCAYKYMCLQKKITAWERFMFLCTRADTRLADVKILFQGTNCRSRRKTILIPKTPKFFKFWFSQCSVVDFIFTIWDGTSDGICNRMEIKLMGYVAKFQKSIGLKSVSKKP